MNLSREAPDQTEQRLRQVARAATLVVHPATWWYEEFPLDQFAGRIRADALALVRDPDGWSQLVPVQATDQPRERFRIWSCHFSPSLDNSGFVGWLATHIKQRTGSGVFVVCGQNSGRGGIYDYWGCPADAAETVLAEVRTLLLGPPRADLTKPIGVASLDGVRMRAVATGDGGEVNRDTLFLFTQDGSTVAARYAGGNIRLGYLVGTLSDGELVFRYAQVDHHGEVHGGHSSSEITVLPDGRVRLLEHFHWESRAGSGTNVLEEVPA